MKANYYAALTRKPIAIKGKVIEHAIAVFHGELIPLSGESCCGVRVKYVRDRQFGSNSRSADPDAYLDGFLRLCQKCSEHIAKVQAMQERA
jgi:hypothetical protein